MRYEMAPFVTQIVTDIEVLELGDVAGESR